MKTQNNRKKDKILEKVDKSFPRFMNFEKTDTIWQMKKKVYEHLRGVFKDAIDDEDSLNSQIKIHVRDNIPLVNTTKHRREKPECEFC